jgi:hypothetical protein
MDELPLRDELLPDRPDTALRPRRDKTIAALIHRVEGHARIVAHAPSRLIENFQACQHLIRRLQAGVTHDIGEPEGLDPLTGRSTFPTELEEYIDHGEHSLDQRQHLSSLLGSASREMRRARLRDRQGRRIKTERNRELVLEPSPHFRRGRPYLLRR